MIQLPRVPSIEVITPPLFAFMHSFQSQGEISFKGEGCNTPCYGNPNQRH
jgi:hypothetical protein